MSRYHRPGREPLQAIRHEHSQTGNGAGPPWSLILCAGGSWWPRRITSIPEVELALNTVTTDDAYVNSHATQVAPRITENVREVRVDNNDFVKKGTC